MQDTTLQALEEGAAQQPAEQELAPRQPAAQQPARRELAPGQPRPGAQDFRWLALASAALLVTAGCGRSGTSERPGEEREGRSVTGALEGEPALSDPARAAVESGPIDVWVGADTSRVRASEALASDARAIGRFDLVRRSDCARVRVPFFGATGAPATLPGVGRGEVLRSLGVVRFPLPGIVEIVQADTTIEGGDPIRALYVVRAPNSTLHLDVHLSEAALLRSVALSDPARLLVDASPGGGAIPAPAATHANVVVLEPRAGAAAYPLSIRGYGRTFEANVIARLSRNGEVVAQTHTTAADWSMTWGEFEMTIPKGPSGRLELFVGEDDAESGRERGVRIPVVMP